MGRLKRGVLGEGDIAEVVQRLDTPVSPDPVGQAGRVSLGGGEVGDPYTLTVRQRRLRSGRIRRVMRMAWVAWGKSRPATVVTCSRRSSTTSSR